MTNKHSTVICNGAGSECRGWTRVSEPDLSAWNVGLPVPVPGIPFRDPKECGQLEGHCRPGCDRVGQYGPEQPEYLV